MKKVLILVLALILFHHLFYEIYPFVYGSAANLEELPLIYKLMGFAEYSKDEYVLGHFVKFTQVTPYLTGITLLAKLFHCKDLVVLFYILHLLTLALMYFAIRRIFKQLGYTCETQIIFSIISLLLLIKTINVIPNQRNLLHDYLDPELVIQPIMFFIIAAHLEKKYLECCLYLVIGTIVHPLYIILLLPGLFGSFLLRFIKKDIDFYKLIKYGSTYFVIVISYSLFLLIQSNKASVGEIDASLVEEIIRGPHHFIIPTLFHFDKTTTYFYIYSLLLNTISFFLYKRNKNVGNKFKVNFLDLSFINYFIFIFLIIVTIIATFKRIPLLVELTPYRAGLASVVITWIVFISSLTNSFNLKTENLIKADLIVVSLGILIFFGLSLFRTSNREKAIEKFPERKEFINWLIKNTKPDDLFLNYTDVDIRTKAFRCDYYRYQTGGITTDLHLSWYKKFQIYFDIPETIKPDQYNKMINYARSKHVIYVTRVLSKSKEPINYVLILKAKRSFSPVEEFMGVKNKNYNYDVSGLKKVYENKEYLAFTTSH